MLILMNTIFLGGRIFQSAHCLEDIYRLKAMKTNIGNVFI